MHSLRTLDSYRPPPTLGPAHPPRLQQAAIAHTIDRGPTDDAVQPSEVTTENIYQYRDQAMMAVDATLTIGQWLIDRGARTTTSPKTIWRPDANRTCSVVQCVKGVQTPTSTSASSLMPTQSPTSIRLRLNDNVNHDCISTPLLTMSALLTLQMHEC